MKAGKRILVISDTHFNAELTAQGAELFKWLNNFFSQYDVVVMNGDCFEISNSHWMHRKEHYSDHKEVAANAALWAIGNVLQDNPHAQFKYVLGNHDCESCFVEPFKANINNGIFSNIEVFDKYCRIGDALFLHGDLPWHHREEGTYPFSNPILASAYVRTYITLEPLILSGLADNMYNNDRICERVSRYLKSELSLNDNDVRGVFLGHTHRPFDHNYNGVRFLNTGIPRIKDRDFFLEIEMHGDSITEIKNVPCPSYVGTHLSQAVAER